MVLSLFLDRDTWLHRTHPVVRVVGMFAFFVCAFVVERPPWMLPLVAVLVPMLIQTGAVANVYRLRLLFAMAFVMTFLIWTIFYGPDGHPPLFQWRRITISETSPLFALGMALKLDVFLATGVLFLSTTRIEDFAYALTRMGVPFKLAFTLTLAFRLVPVFLESALAVVQAQRCRGLDFDRGNILERMRRYVPVIIPVIMGGLRRADQMAMALEARGFQRGGHRTFFEEFRVGIADVAVLFVLAVLVAVYLRLWSVGRLAFAVP